MKKKHLLLTVLALVFALGATLAPLSAEARRGRARLIIMPPPDEEPANRPRGVSR